MKRIPTTPLILVAALVLGACAGEKKPGDDAASPTPATPTASSTEMGENLSPDPGGKIIAVQMLTDDQGNNRFEPSDFEAHQGDVIRFTLKTGVHNVNFPADSNSGTAGLPAASQMLQLPGQTVDLKVSLPEGKYYFHCDPHAALGMKARLEVENKES